MQQKWPRPLTRDDLQELRDRFGSDRLAKLLLWEIARLRDVVMVLYRQVIRLSYGRPNDPAVYTDEETESLIENEPVIMESTRAITVNFKYGRKARYPHMSDEAEAALNAKKEADAKARVTERELKRDARDVRNA